MSAMPDLATMSAARPKCPVVADAGRCGKPLMTRVKSGKIIWRCPEHGLIGSEAEKVAA